MTTSRTKPSHTNNAQSAFVAQALVIARLGFRVVPAGNTSERRHPLVHDWPHEATCDEDKIRQWGGQFPDAAVAIVTGAGIWALDADVPEFLQERWGKPLPQTARVRSGGGGLHLIFKHDSCSTEKLLPLGNTYIRNAGGTERDKALELFCGSHSLHAPGTLHYKTGCLYRWEKRTEPQVAPPEFVDFLASLEWATKPGTGAEDPTPVASTAVCVLKNDRNAQELFAALSLKRRSKTGDKDGTLKYHPARPTACPVSGHKHRGGSNSVWVLFYNPVTRVLWFHCEGGGCAQFRGIDRTRAALQALGVKSNEWLEDPAVGKIVVGQDPTATLVIQCEQLLMQRQTPGQQIFQRGSALVRFARHRALSENERSLVRRPDEANVIVPLSRHYLYLALSETRRFYRQTQKGLVRIEPPSQLSSLILDRVVTNEENTGWPPLRMQTTTPVLLQSGEIVSEPGYHRDSGIWLDTGDVQFPSVPDRPTPEEARRALEAFHAIYHRFDFVRTGSEDWYQTPSFAAIVATTLSILARNLLPTVPLLGISAPIMGSGKTKIAESIVGSTTGHRASYMAYDGREEFDKSLFDPLSKGDRVILIDNINHPFQSDRLCAVLTSRGESSWRVLGESRNARVRNEAVFIATGNNLAITGDLPRRCLLAKLDPNVERPEQRAFDFDPPGLATQLFPRLVVAGLTAIRAYQQADCPVPRSITSHLGSFDEWSKTIRGCLVWLGYADPIATQGDIRTEDPFLAADAELLATWYLEFGDSPRSIREIALKYASTQTYQILTGATNQYWNPVKIAGRLRRLKGRVLAGFKLVSSTVGSTHGTRWRVLRVPGEHGKDVHGMKQR